MVVRTLWPGATAEEVSRQVTERIEKALMETAKYEFIRSYSRPGESQIIFVSKDSLVSSDLPEVQWGQAWIKTNSEIRDATSFGVLKFILHQTSYEWAFIPVSGGTFQDTGQAACVR
jgi:multidrug efflux pump